MTVKGLVLVNKELTEKQIWRQDIAKQIALLSNEKRQIEKSLKTTINKKARFKKIKLNALQQISLEELCPGVSPLIKPPTPISPAVSIPINPLIKSSPAMSLVVSSPVTPLTQISPSYGYKLIRHIPWVKEVRKQLFHDSVNNRT